MATTATPARSWRYDLPVHPAAELFPRMNGRELRALGEDIKKNGLASPIVLWSDGESPALLIDGRNRLDAIETAIGRPVNVDAGYEEIWINKDDCNGRRREWRDDGGVTTVGPPCDPYEYVISANIRRHLSIEEKDRLIVKVLQADPTKSNRQVAKLTDTSHPHVAKVREQAEKVGDVETVTTSIDTKGRQQPARKPERKPKQQIGLEDAIAAADADPEVSAAARKAAYAAEEQQHVEERADIASAGNGEVEEAKAARAAQHDDQPSEWEWKPKCLAHLPVADRLEMLVGLLQDGLTPVKDLVAALRLQANASVTTRSKLDGLEGMAGHIFTWINVVRDEVAEIKQQLVAYEQRGTANDGLDMPRTCDDAPPPPESSDELDIPDYLPRRAAP